MARTSYHLKILWPIALTSLLTFALCTFMAVLLFRQQQSVTEELSENVVSRRAAADLEESLLDLIARLQKRAEDVDALHERIEGNLEEINRFADKERERQLSATLDESFRRYLAAWHALPAKEPARQEDVWRIVALLETETLKHCRDLRDYNAQQIEESEKEQSEAVQRLAWGFGAVGVAGGLAGLLLGYGVARALRRTIHRLQIHVQDAAGKLGQEWPAIVLTEEGDLERLHEQMLALTGRIEEVVERLQQREREVLRAEQLAAVGQLAAGVAHEIRNPLTAIKMLVQGVREGGAGRRLSDADLEVIEHEIRRIERSLKTFLDFARPPRLTRAPLDLARLVDHTLTLVQGRAAKQRVTLVFPRPEDPVIVEADGEQMQQVMVNLALNALDAMPRGGRLEVLLRPGQGGDAEVSVTDTGPGVSAEMLPRLFQPFASSKETGLGLGLVVLRRIVEEHGGRLWAQNRLEGGACFTFRLPKVPRAA